MILDSEFASCMQTLSLLQTRSNYSLDELKQLAHALGNPQKYFPSIHVTGSNGKGSVSHKIARALSSAGYKVGLFTSPHLHCYTERITIGNQPISKDEVVKGLNEIFAISQQMEFALSSFAFTTLLGLLHFKNKQIDVAVIEVGIGGRLDATVIVEPIVTIITSVSLEHTELLGGTLDLIAKEKAGIFKPFIPAILGPKAQLPSAIARAQELACPLSLCEKVGESFDEENSQIAAKALCMLQDHFPRLSQDLMQSALNDRPSCRMEVAGRFIFDVAHNPDAFLRLFCELKKRYAHQSIDVIIGMSEDKDIRACLTIAAEHARLIYLTSAGTARSASPESMAAILDQIGNVSYILAETVYVAVEHAQHDAEAITVVCGSFYIMDEAKRAMRRLAASLS